MRIDRPVECAVAAHPFEKFLPGLAHHRFGRPMDHDNPRALLHERIKLVEFGIQEMPLMTRAEDDDRVRIFQHRRMTWVTHFRKDLSINPKIRILEYLG